MNGPYRRPGEEGNRSSRGGALSNAPIAPIDGVADLADPRGRPVGLLRAVRPPAPRAGTKRPAVNARSW
jgi:hypothetical protein